MTHACMPLSTQLFLRSLRGKALAKKATRKTRVDAVLAKHEGALKTTILKVLREKAKQIARQLRGRYEHHMKAIPSWATDLADEVDTDGVGIAVREAITTTIEQVFKQAGLTGIAEVEQDATGAMLQHMDVEALKYATQRGADLVTSISGTTRDELRDLTVDAVEQGLSPQAFASSIEDSLSFSEARSEMIARTELAFAQVSGNMTGYRTSGVVEKKQWLASEDACPICDDLDGKTIDIDDDFDFDGEAIDAPPGHPNCRCDVLPITSQEND